MFSLSLAQTDAQVSGEAARDANGDLQKFIIAKQWKIVEETSSKIDNGNDANKRAVDRPEELQKRGKNCL